MYIGRVNNEAIDIDTNVLNLNPLINSAMLLPLADFKNAKKLNIPFEPKSALTMSHGFEYFCQFLMKGPIPSPPMFSIDWNYKSKYETQKPSDNIAIKIDGVLSYIAYKTYKDSLKLSPFSIVYSEDDYKVTKSWLESLGLKKTPCIFIDYEKFGNVKDIMNKYENWIAATVASNKTNTVWLGIAKTEISNYIPDRATRLFDDGSNWLTKGLERKIIIESPFEENKTRSIIIKDAVESGMEADKIRKAMRCNCGRCFECFMNNVAFTNNDIDIDDFKGRSLIDRLNKLIEFKKLDKILVNEIKDYIT